MHAARIAELLTPFLSAEPARPMVRDSMPVPNACHSEPARSGGEEPAFLSPIQLQNISTYINLLLRWNARINLTAIRDEEEIITRHFGESLFAARHLFPSGVGAEAFVAPADHPGRAALRLPRASEARPGDRVEGRERGRASAPAADDIHSARINHRGRTALQGRVDDQNGQGALAPAVTLADLGSGAGFPGIPIKLWAPEISLTLIESNHKKATFLGEVTRALTLTDVNIRIARAESLRDLAFNIVTLRAVERFGAILPTAASLLASNGRFALLIGSSQLDELKAALPHLSWSTPVQVPLSRNRILAVGQRL